MSTSQKGKILVELGRTLTEFEAMTDSGDHTIFTAGTLFSGKAGYEPDIRPNGIYSGYNLLSPHATADTVTVAGFKAYSGSTLYTVAAGSLALTRPSTSTHKICAVTMTDAGVLAEVEGTESTSFSDTFGAPGGPPLIPVDSVLLGLVRFSAQASAVIAESEIYQNMGEHAEYYDYPKPEVFNLGKGSNAEESAAIYSHVEFNTALPIMHTGSVAKKVYAQYYTPTFVTLPRTADFVPAELGISKSSETYYEGAGGSGAIGSMKADSVGDASFTILAGDGITDAILREKGKTITVKWFSDANKTPYMLQQGMLGVSREFPQANQNKIKCTVYCEKESVEFTS